MKQTRSMLLLLICAASISLTAKARDKKDKKDPVVTVVDKTVGTVDHTVGKITGRPKEGKQVPLNNGITFLLAAGTALGIKKVLDKKRVKVLAN